MLVALTASFENLPLDRVAAVTPARRDLAARLGEPEGPDGWVLLSTCNRVELYLDAPAFHGAVDLAAGTLAEATGRPVEAVLETFSVSVEDAAARHLGEVASGLRSMVLGEAEITGQVRAAFHDALHDGTTTPLLNDLFQQSLRTGKQVAAETAVGAAGRSGAAVALDRAVELLGPLSGCRVLVIGTGSYARIAVAELRGRSAGEIAVWSGSGRAGPFAASRDVRAADAGADALASELAVADLVVACSGQGAVVTADRARAAGETLVLDLALVSDLAPAVADLPHLTVLGLTSLAADPDSVSASERERAHEIVVAGLTRFRDRRAERDVVPAISALRGAVRDSAEAELASARRRLPAGTVDEVERSLRRILRRVLHVPTERARGLAREGRADEYLEALHLVLGVDIARDTEVPLSQVEGVTRGHELEPERGGVK